jgi:hypothetical protein
MGGRVAPDIGSVLARLEGQTIATLTGKPNRVLRVTGDTVWVGTARSPHGKPVPIAEIQAAADQLFARGEVEIDVSVVGYRSAFVGAVLATLPNTIARVNPRRIALVRPRA